MPFGENVPRRDDLAEGQRGENGQLGARVEAIDIVAGIGLGVSQPLRLGEHGFERRAVLLHLGEDVVAGAVEDAVERHHAVAGDAFPQHGVDGNPARHAGLHGDVGAGLDGALPDFRAAQRHQFLIGGDDRLLRGDGGIDDLGGDGGAADQFDHDIQARMFDQPPPVVGLENRSQRFGNLLGIDQQVADGPDPQMKPELESDLIGVLRQNLAACPNRCCPDPLSLRSRRA